MSCVRVAILIVGGAALAHFGCKGKTLGDDPRNACEPTLVSLQTTVFARSCATVPCHAGDMPSAGLDLTRADLEAQLVGVASSNCVGWSRVKPGDPAGSYLWNKVSEAEPACGLRMPLDTALSQSDRDCISGWIAGLDPNACEKCGGTACVTLATDPNHCGSCDVSCPAGVACQDGACLCPASLTACGASCTDTSLDAANCGACGTSCGPGGRCEMGTCACVTNLTACTTGCADTLSDAQNCGGCGAVCDADTVCLFGQCVDGCGTLAQCGASCVDLTSNVSHCGACDLGCAPGLSCIDGACACPGTGTLCGGMCIETASDPANCGSCGKACSPGETCQAGQCVCEVNSSVSFAGDIQPLFTTNCTERGCHSGRRPQANLGLESGVAYGALVDIPSEQCSENLRVEPGRPSASYLMSKLTGVGMCAGTKMPKADQSLPAAELEAIVGWICAGAPNN